MYTSTYGDGTITLHVEGAAGDPVDFSCEFMSLRVNHEYEEIVPKRKPHCGVERAAVKVRRDSLSANLELDLRSSGLYQYLLDNDLKTAAFVATFTADGASWAGNVQLTLPTSPGADEYGQPITSDIALEGVGAFTFTAAA